MVIEIVYLPLRLIVIFHSYLSLSEGMTLGAQDHIGKEKGCGDMSRTDGF